MSLTVGERVRFRLGDASYEGEVREVFMAGKPGGTGIWRERERVRVAFEDGGQSYETNRDLDAVERVTQPGLFA